MKVLVVMSNYPFPPRTGSSIVAFNALRLLSRRHQISLICSRPAKELAAPAEYIERMELVVQQEMSRFSKWIRYFSYMFLGVPPSVSIYASNAMRKKVESEVEKGNFDVVLLFEMSAIQYCPARCFGRLVVNIEDPQSIKLYRMSGLSVWSPWKKAKLLMLAWFTAFYERRVLHNMAKVLLLSKADIDDVKSEFSFNNISCVPYGVDRRVCSDILEYEDRDKVIIFSGSMYHPPNVDGALYFINELFPLILDARPAAKLLIVGAEPDSRIFKASAKYGKQIEITGSVPNIADYIRRAAVSVCPVRLRIGVQTKILEALSWGTPTVTTSAGNRGVDGVSGTHLWVEDDAHKFAKRVCDLLDGIDWEKLSAEGRRLVAERFTWEASAAQLEQHLIGVAAKNS